MSPVLAAGERNYLLPDGITLSLNFTSLGSNIIGKYVDNDF